MTDEEIPRLRDRNLFFHILLNGDEMTFEKVHPQWKERRQPEKETGEKTRSSRRPVEMVSPRLQDLQAQVERDKKTKRTSCWLLFRIRGARHWIRRANKLKVHDDAMRAELGKCEKKISRRLSAVRKHASNLNQADTTKPFDREELAKLHISDQVDDKTRKRKHNELKRMLDAYERQTRVIRGHIGERKRTLKRERRKGGT